MSDLDKSKNGKDVWSINDEAYIYNMKEVNSFGKTISPPVVNSSSS